jgi:hypothetical protein
MRKAGRRLTLGDDPLLDVIPQGKALSGSV